MHRQRRLRLSNSKIVILIVALAVTAGVITGRPVGAQQGCTSVTLGDGQTLSAVYRANNLQVQGVTFDTFKRWNSHLGNLDQVKAGDKVCISDPAMASAAPVAAPVTATETPSTAAPPGTTAAPPATTAVSTTTAAPVTPTVTVTVACQDGWVQRQVISGDTYFAIAMSFGVSVDTLLAKNGLTLADMLKAGGTICVPNLKLQPPVGATTTQPQLGGAAQNTGSRDKLQHLPCGSLLYVSPTKDPDWQTMSSVRLCPGVDPYTAYVLSGFGRSYEEFLEESDVASAPTGSVLYMNTSDPKGKGEAAFRLDYGALFANTEDNRYGDQIKRDWTNSIAKPILEATSLPEDLRGEDAVKVAVHILGIVDANYRNRLTQLGWEPAAPVSGIEAPLLDMANSGKTLVEMLQFGEYAIDRYLGYGNKMAWRDTINIDFEMRFREWWLADPYLATSEMDDRYVAWMADELKYRVEHNQAFLYMPIIGIVWTRLKGIYAESGPEAVVAFLEERVRNQNFGGEVDAGRKLVQDWQSGTLTRAIPDENPLAGVCPEISTCDVFFNGVVTDNGCGTEIASCGGFSKPSLDDECGQGHIDTCADPAMPKPSDLSCADQFGASNCADPKFKERVGCSASSPQDVASCAGEAGVPMPNCFDSSHLLTPCAGGSWQVDPLQPWNSKWQPAPPRGPVANNAPVAPPTATSLMPAGL